MSMLEQMLVQEIALSPSTNLGGGPTTSINLGDTHEALCPMSTFTVASRGTIFTAWGFRELPCHRGFTCGQGIAIGVTTWCASNT